jgi:hypothetical protein
MHAVVIWRSRIIAEFVLILGTKIFDIVFIVNLKATLFYYLHGS